MTNDDLDAYVSNQISQGVNLEVLRLALDAEGVDKAEVEAAISKASSESFATSGGTTTPKFSTPEPIPVASAPVSAQKFNGKRWGIAASVVVGVAILAAGGVYGYEYMNNTPEKITQRFLTNYESIKSLDYSGSINFQIVPAESGQDFNGQIVFAGSSDMTDANPKSKTNFKFTGEGFNVDLDAISANQSAYVKVNEFPALDFLDGGEIKDQWIKVDPKALAEEYDTTGEVSASLQTTNQAINIQDLLTKHKVLKLTNKMPSEKIDNTATYHYAFEIDKDQLAQFMLEAAKSSSTASGASEQEIKDSLDKFWNNAAVSDGQIWLGKKDYLPRKISMKISVNSPDAGAGTVSLTLNSGNFNKPTQIVVPESTTDIQSLIEDLGDTEISK